MPLERNKGELVRAFVREAALAEGAPAGVSCLISDDVYRAWGALGGGNAPGRAHIAVSATHAEIRSRILLEGHSRYSSVVQSIAGCIRSETALSIRERGVDGWELSFHRRLTEEVGPLEASEACLAEGEAGAGQSETIDIAPPTRQDAAAIARCFLEVYGHNYVHTEVFSPECYWRKVENGALIPVVAKNEKGDVVGHVALEREPGAAIAERGEAVVVQAYRGRHLLERMTEKLSQAALEIGLAGIFAMPVTVHTFSQRNDERAGMPICGVLLGAANESSHAKGVSAPTSGQRQSLLLAFRFLQKRAPSEVYLPAPYRDVILRLYRSLDNEPRIGGTSAPSSASSKTSLHIDHRGYGKISFEEIGAAADLELKQALHDIRSLGARAVQLSGRLMDPGLPFLTESARKLGFFFCGIGPAFSQGQDALLLQHLTDPLETRKLQLFSQQAKDLVAFIDQDRADCAAGSTA